MKSEPYWWEAAPRPDIAATDLPAKADVVIVGSGYTGLIAALKLAEAGRHVVCEKPMATSLADADDMIRAAQQSHRILSIFQNRRFEALFNKVQQIIDAPGCPGISTAPVNRFGRRR